MIYLRLLVLIIPVIIFFLFEWFFLYPKMIYVSLVLVNSLFFFTTWQFSRISLADKKWWNFFILPAVLSTGLAAYSATLANRPAIQILFIANSAFLYFYLRLVYYRLIEHPSYKEENFENISSYGNFLSFFFTAAAIYSLQSFLNAPVWLLMAILLAVTAIIVYQAVWSAKIDIKRGIIYILIICLSIIELGWSISFLPLNFNTAGLVLAICYYLIISFSKFHILGRLNNKIIKIYLSFGLLSIIFALLTARWM